ncbi:MAG: PAS domain S-box protein, partial [bacterium]
MPNQPPAPNSAKRPWWGALIPDGRGSESSDPLPAEIYRVAAQGSLDAFFLFVAERDAAGTILDFRCADANERAAQMTRRTVPEMIGARLTELNPATREAGFIERYAHVIATGQPHREESCLSRPDGALRWFQYQIVKIGDGVAVDVRDITEQRVIEEELAQRERHLRALTEWAPVGIWETDATGVFAWANPQIAEIIGCPPEGFAPSDLSNLIHPDDRDRVLEVWGKARAARQPYESAYRVVRPNGEIRYVISRAQPAFEVDGTFRGYVGAMSDLTEQRRQEAAIRESEARFKALAETVPIGVWQSDANGVSSYINPRLSRIYQMGLEELQGDPAGRYLHDEDRGWLRARWAEAIAARTGFEADWRIVRADGASRWVHGHSTPLFDSQGHFSGQVGSLEDITERRQLEEALLALATTAIDGREQFYEGLTAQLAAVLHADTVILAELVAPHHARPISFWHRGPAQEPGLCDLVGTPCAEITLSRMCYVPAKVQDLYPGDTMVKELGAESFAGCRVIDSTGANLGILVVLHREPTSLTPIDLMLIETFATRAGAEMERFRALAQLAVSQADYRDIIERQEEFITRYRADTTLTFVNRALADYLGIPEKAMIGRKVLDF